MMKSIHAAVITIVAVALITSAGCASSRPCSSGRCGSGGCSAGVARRCRKAHPRRLILHPSTPRGAVKLWQVVSAQRSCQAR